MPSFVHQFPRGRAYTQIPDYALGKTAEVNTLHPGTGVGVGARTKAAGLSQQIMLVKNSTGVTLRPKAVVKWKSGLKFREVDGYTNVTAEECAGVVDPLLPATGVAANSYFWLVTAGECITQTPADGSSFGGDIAVGDILYALTVAASTGVTAGRLRRWVTTFSATDTTDGTAGKITMNYFARAMSAKTTNQSSADILVDVRRRY